MTYPERKRASIWVLNFSLFALALVIIWWAWDDVVVFSGNIYTRPGDSQYEEFSIHTPSNAAAPLTAVVVLHGYGASGQKEREAMRQTADEHGWLIVAPTFHYGPLDAPNEMRIEDPANMARIASFLDRLPEVTGSSIQKRVLVYGFSRGAQTAHRFALAYPDRVAAVAVMSAGTYTIPASTFGDGAAPLLFPFGVADLADLIGQPFAASEFARIPFWIGVGDQDSVPADVPHQWDPYIGKSRLDRAQQFDGWLTRSGSQAEVHVFPGIGHDEATVMRTAAVQFLAAHSGDAARQD